MRLIASPGRLLAQRLRGAPRRQHVTMVSAAAAPKKVLIVGGVAGGASCAARLRRLDEHAEITIFERGPFVSFANCGLPYHVGDVIKEEAKLLVATPAKFAGWFNVGVRSGAEVTGIDRTARTVTVRDTTGKEETHAYDALVLSPGAAAIKPPLPGIDLPGIFTMKTIPDTRAVKGWLAEAGGRVKGARPLRAVVVGGGFIGLEMVENLRHLGLDVTVVEMLPQVMAPLDPEMAEIVHTHLRSKGVTLALGDGVAGFAPAPSGDGLVVRTAAGKEHPADIVMLNIGVRPETALAKGAGLALGQRGGIKVDASMRTSDPSIWAVGDAVEVTDWVTQEAALIPLAGPANRQGRIAADAIAGRASTFRGVQGTAVVGVMGLTVASTGASEKTLKRSGIPYEKVYTHANNHAGYYPGATTIDFKLLFDPKDGRVLGAQAVGEGEGVEKRIDVVAMALQFRGTVQDLEQAELCYAPQYGSAKDVVNLAAMVAANVVRGDVRVVHWGEGPLAPSSAAAGQGAIVLDVREPGEVARGSFPGALNIPLPTLRAKLAAGELAADKEYLVYCQVGLRGYLATRQMSLAGLHAANISGGWRSYQFAKALAPAKL